MGIRVAHIGAPIVVLSGGNQQKVIIARWLAAKPKVLLLNDPTRGIDLGAKRDLYRVLEQLTAEGVGVVMLSTEIDEHLELMDRVLVFREGGVVSDIARDDLSRNGLVASFFGPAGKDQNGS
jgi:ABC-type sugar transport system ATPase subunit